MRLHRLISIFIIVSLLCAAATGFADSKTITPNAPLLTLNEAILLALRYNPSVRNAELQRILDKFSLRLAENAYEVQYALTGSANYQNTISSGNRSESATYNVQPQLSVLTAPGATFTLSGNNPITKTMSGGGTYYNPGVTLQVTQPLLRGFGPEIVLTPLYNARDQELINQLTLKAQMIATVTAVISQYITVVQDKNSLKTQQLSINASIATLKQQQALVKAGRAAPADLVQFQSSVASQQASLQQALIQLQQDEYTLLNTLGLNPSTLFTVPDKVTMDDKVPTLVESVRIALDNNTAYQQALINIKILKRNLVVAKDQQRWQLNLTATRVQGGGSGASPNSGLDSLINGRNQSTNIGLALNIPIHNLSLQQQLIQAKVQLQNAQISLAANERLVESAVKTGYNTLIIQKQKLVLDQQAIDLANKSLIVAQTKLKYGRSTPFEVSTLQVTLTQNQLNYITDQQNYINVLASFEQTIGTTLEQWNIQVRY